MAGEGIPWESRARYGFFPALFETVKLFITRPAEAWSRTRPKGNMLDPLLFAILVSWVGMFFRSVYGVFFTIPWLRFMPPEFRDRFGPSLLGSGISAVAQIVFAPILIAIGLFIGSAILHLCLMIVGGLAGSSSDFEGTVRAVAYSAVADLAAVIPLFGGIIAAVWKIVLVVMGLMALHKASQGKAVAAVLIPLVVCCGCLVGGAVLLATVFVGMLHK